MPIDYLRTSSLLSEDHAQVENASTDNVTKIAAIDIDGCLFNQYFYEFLASNLIACIIRMRMQKTSKPFEPQLAFKSYVEISLFTANQDFFNLLQSEGFKEFFSGSARQSVKIDFSNGRMALRYCLDRAQSLLPLVCERLNAKPHQQEIAALLETLNQPDHAFYFTSFYIFPLIEKKFQMTYLKFLSADVYSNRPMGSAYSDFGTATEHAMSLFDDSKLLDLTPKLHVLSGKTILSFFDDRGDIIHGFAEHFSAHPERIPDCVEALNFYIYVSEIDLDATADINKMRLTLVASIKGTGSKKDAYLLTQAMARETFNQDLEARAEGEPAQQFMNPSTCRAYKTYDECAANHFIIGATDRSNRPKMFNALQYIDTLPDSFYEQFNLPAADKKSKSEPELGLIEELPSSQTAIVGSSLLKRGANASGVRETLFSSNKKEKHGHSIPEQAATHHGPVLGSSSAGDS